MSAGDAPNASPEKQELAEATRLLTLLARRSHEKGLKQIKNIADFVSVVSWACYDIDGLYRNPATRDLFLKVASVREFIATVRSNHSWPIGREMNKATKLAVPLVKPGKPARTPGGAAMREQATYFVRGVRQHGLDIGNEVESQVRKKLLSKKLRNNPSSWAKEFTEWMKDRSREWLVAQKTTRNQFAEPSDFPLGKLAGARLKTRKKSNDRDRNLWTAFRAEALRFFRTNLPRI